MHFDVTDLEDLRGTIMMDGLPVPAVLKCDCGCGGDMVAVPGTGREPPAELRDAMEDADVVVTYTRKCSACGKERDYTTGGMLAPRGIFGDPPFVREAPKVGRNRLCPCGSGKKYKKCCEK